VARELVVISGKGGTGKTSIAAAFFTLAQNSLLCDADVDAANLHLLMRPKVREHHDFQGGHQANIDPERCNACGVCRDVCRYDAVGDDFSVDPLACEGCGVCVHFCPQQAIDFPRKTCGQWFVSETPWGTMVHARLGVAEENSGKLVALVRREAQQLAETQGAALILTDGPPGVGCPVIASVGGASAVLIVTEPSVAGLHDMQRVAQLAAHFHVPRLLCINKHDLSPQTTQRIEAQAQELGIPVIGRVPYDPVFTRAMVQGVPLFQYQPDSRVAHTLKQIWSKIQQALAIDAQRRP
jgi:MinD superfamily P-loop ATPase